LSPELTILRDRIALSTETGTSFVDWKFLCRIIKLHSFQSLIVVYHSSSRHYDVERSSIILYSNNSYINMGYYLDHGHWKHNLNSKSTSTIFCWFKFFNRSI
jgi:hypothetical protein